MLIKVKKGLHKHKQKNGHLSQGALDLPFFFLLFSQKTVTVQTNQSFPLFNGSSSSTVKFNQTDFEPSLDKVKSCFLARQKFVLLELGSCI